MVSETGAYISVKNLEKSFHGLSILKGINLEAEPGDLTVLIGPSGCGKSTLLRCLNGLEVLDSGSITVNGVDLKPQNTENFKDSARKIRSSVGMVFQSFNLFPHLTVLENVSKAPMVVKGLNVKDAENVALELLEKVGLHGHADHYPSQLSGGQQQRAAIARALALSPKAMLYDEPTSSLDPELVDEVLQVMRKLDSEGMTQIVVTHEMRFARDVADNVAYLEAGKIIEMGPPEQMFTTPQDERTKRFLRKFL